MQFPADNLGASSYAVVGDPVAHSLSPLIHGAFAEQFDAEIDYVRWQLSAAQFDEAIRQFFAAGGGGLNVTVPHKQAAYGLCNQLSERARTAEAVNTLYAVDGAIYGDNTDGLGLVSDLQRLQWLNGGEHIVIVGAGGAVQGVLQPLLATAPASISVLNRTHSKAVDLCAQFAELAAAAGSELLALPLDASASVSVDLLINATSAGIGGEVADIDPAFVEAAHCYDMFYAADSTAFMRWAESHSAAAVADGLGMLVGQAAESYRIWRGQQPAIEPVLQRLRQQLAR